MSDQTNLRKVVVGVFDEKSDALLMGTMLIPATGNNRRDAVYALILAGWSLRTFGAWPDLQQERNSNGK